MGLPKTHNLLSLLKTVTGEKEYKEGVHDETVTTDDIMVTFLKRAHGVFEEYGNSHGESRTIRLDAGKEDYYSEDGLFEVFIEDVPAICKAIERLTFLDMLEDASGLKTGDIGGFAQKYGIPQSLAEAIALSDSPVQTAFDSICSSSIRISGFNPDAIDRGRQLLNFAIRMRNLRRQKGMTVSDVSSATGIPVDVLEGIEKQEYYRNWVFDLAPEVSDDMIKKVADLLGSTPSRMMGTTWREIHCWEEENLFHPECDDPYYNPDSPFFTRAPEDAQYSHKNLKDRIVEATELEEKNKSFGFWLNNKRDDFHITRNELSHESGVSEWDIELIENTPTSFDEGVYERLYDSMVLHDEWRMDVDSETRRQFREKRENAGLDREAVERYALVFSSKIIDILEDTDKPLFCDDLSRLAECMNIEIPGYMIIDSNHNFTCRMEELGMNEQELAERSGLDMKKISRLLSWNYPHVFFREDELEKVLDALGLEIVEETESDCR